jgi:hypothetical protein
LRAIRFRSDLPLEETMAFDAVYPEPLQYDLVEKAAILATPGSVAIWMFVGEELVGESYGIPLASDDEDLPWIGSLPPEERAAGIYCYSNTILPPHQRGGYGKILKAHWLGLVKGKGFRVVYGQARPGASQRLNADFGAEFLDSFPDYAGTGEEYRLYRLTLA